MGFDTSVLCDYAELGARVLEEVSNKSFSLVMRYDLWMTFEDSDPEFHDEIQCVFRCLICHELSDGIPCTSIDCMKTRIAVYPHNIDFYLVIEDDIFSWE